MVLNRDIFLGAGTSLTFIPECDIGIGVGLQSGGTAFDGSTEVSVIQGALLFTNNFSLVNNLYAGCLLERYNSADTLLSTHRIKSNTNQAVTIADTVTPASDDYFVIKSYGAPVPSTVDSSTKRLLSDQWLGILESATFPSVDPDFKQVNLSLGGSRNYTYQYKGITNFGAGDLSLVANHGAWLYYFLGKCTNVNATVAAITNLTDNFHVAAADTGKILIEAVDASGDAVAAGTGVDMAGIVETGPIFYRTKTLDICPPISDNAVEDTTDLKSLTRPSINSSGQITDAITYTFAEQDSDVLPSFAMELTHSKLPSSDTYRSDITSISLTGGVTTANQTSISYDSDTNVEVGMLISGTNIPAHTRIAEVKSATTAELTNAATAGGTGIDFTLTQDEDLNFTQIARGCRVNTLTMTANENEEVKMQLSLNPRNVHAIAEDESYDARGAVTNDADFFNYEGENSGANAAQEFREPFFFSDGRFSVLGQEFLKINSMSLTMSNNLQDRRFLGVGTKEIQESIPAQRTYELSFSGHVSDNALYKALRDDTENISQTIELVFTKPNGENITLNFTDYFVDTNSFPIADDKGAIVVDATVKPRNLSLCTVKTHWVLQG